MGLRMRRWQLRALDTQHLRRWLREHGVVEVVDPSSARTDEVQVELPSSEVAAELLRDLVRDGVPMVSQAPAAGALEQVYLGLESDRA
jgi:hypothetical protein